MWIVSTNGKFYNAEVMQNIEADENEVIAKYVGSYHLVLGEYKDADEAQIALGGIINAMETTKSVHYMYKP